MDPKGRGLGRGLNALFEDEEGDFQQGGVDLPDGVSKRDVLGLDQMEPGPGQPRTIFKEEALEELSDSIKQHGVLQPLLVRKNENDDRYQIVAGERRWRAAQRAQLHEIPVIVLDVTDAEAFEIALIENLQREDLDPIDEAVGYQKLIDEHSYTQDKLAKGLGKSRSHIANITRLLQLPKSVQGHLSAGKISIGHARALITAKMADQLVKEVISQNLSVRETEKLVAQDQGRVQKTTKRSAKSEPKKDVDTLALEEDLSSKIGMRVTIDSHDGKSGRVSIAFKSLDQLDVLLQKLAASEVGASGGGRLSA